MKVYGGTVIHHHEYDGRDRMQVRAIVAARSAAEVMRLTGITRGDFNHSWCETSNEQEIAAATARPGVVLWCPSAAARAGERDFQPLGAP